MIINKISNTLNLILGINTTIQDHDFPGVLYRTTTIVGLRLY